MCREVTQADLSFGADDTETGTRQLRAAQALAAQYAERDAELGQLAAALSADGPADFATVNRICSRYYGGYR